MVKYYRSSQTGASPCHLKIIAEGEPVSMDFIEQGGIVIVKRALHAAGILAGARSRLCRHPRLSLSVGGDLGRLHEYLEVADLAEFEHDMLRAFRRSRRWMLGRLLQTLGWAVERRLTVSREVWFRVMFPYELLRRELPQLKEMVGHLVPHNPHRDHWFSQPEETVNVWAALSSVSHGHSVILYPSVFDAVMARAGRSPANEAKLGCAITISLEPGDVLLFAGKHLHASELNTLRRTRVVLSFRVARMTASRARHYGYEARPTP